MEIETWGYDPTDIIPRKSFLVAQKIGGQVIGAFDTELPGAGPEGGPESMVGFAFSLPGVKTEEGKPWPYLHSHMLAVRESYRNRGLGAQLKLKQRDEALARGIRHMEWTFDPLEIKNAFLNIHKLGAIVRAILWISMVYPHLVCRVGCPQTACGRVASGFAASACGAGRPLSHRVHDRRAHSGSGRHLPVEGQ